jgi:hypothetical protein
MCSDMILGLVQLDVVDFRQDVHAPSPSRKAT